MKLENILNLKPTQFAVGMLEVDEKIKLVEKMNKRELKAFIREKPVPVIKGPDSKLYIVDRHHFLCVCYHVGIKDVPIEIVKDLSKSKMSYQQFWKWMRVTKNSYPYTQFGDGPKKEFYLPHDIRGLADDPYRSLAWFVRKSGGFENSDKNFAEFKWANYFRRKNLLDKEGLAGFDRALEKAVHLSQSKEARRLPGYGKLAVNERKKAQKKAKKHAKNVKKPISKELIKNKII